VDVDKEVGKNEFHKNIYIAQEFPKWTPYFFAVLAMWYKVYSKEGLKRIPIEKRAMRMLCL